MGYETLDMRCGMWDVRYGMIDMRIKYQEIQILALVPCGDM